MYFSAQFSQPFKYCSPACRDSDMIRSGRAKQALEKSLSEMRHQYQVILEQTVEEWKPQRQTSHSTPTDEAKEVEMVVFAEHKGAENSPCTSGGDVADEAFGPSFEMTGACGEKGAYGIPSTSWIIVEC